MKPMFWTYLLSTISFDGRSLAFFRIMLGISVVVDLLDRSTVFEVMYTEVGLTPLADLREFYGREIVSFWNFSLHMMHEGYYFQVGMFILAALCATCLILGWNTRLFTVASWVLHTSIMARNPVYYSGADVTLNFMLFWGMYLPLGEYFSVDKIRRKNVGGVSPAIALIGAACYLVQICIVYTRAVHFKDQSWPDGTALMYIMNMDLLVSEFGHWMTAYPSVLSVLSRSSYYLEAFGLILLFLPFFRQASRGICVLLFMGLHGGIAATTDIGLFPFFSMVSWLPFVPGGFWQIVGSPLGYTVATGDRTMATIVPEAKHRFSARRPVTSFKALAQIVSALIAVGTIAIIFVWTWGEGGFREIPLIKDTTGAYLSFTGLTQRWSVFATPKNLSRDGWFVIQGTLSNGSDVDIMRNLSPVDWSKPPLSGRRRLSIIWRSYLAAQERGSGRNLDRFAAYLNSKQEQSHDGNGFEHIRMVFMEETLFVPGQEQSVEKIEFWSGPPPEMR